MKHIYTWILGFVGLASVLAQSTVSTMPPNTANNGGGGATVFEVTASSPVFITGAASVFSASAGTTGPAEVWYKQGSITSNTGIVSVANGWTLGVSGTATSQGSTATTPSSISFGSTMIPLNGSTTYTFVVNGAGTLGGTRYMTGTTGTTNSHTDGTLTIDCSSGRGGSFPNPTITPRYFVGSLTYIPQAACTGTPTAGTSVASLTAVCPLQNFNLSLTGNTVASGLTYQWQSAPFATGPWTNITGATTLVATTSQTSDTWYRCEVICTPSSSSAFSAPVQVTTNSNMAAGTYTIGAGGNFANFTTAFNAASCGVAGPVVFDVISSSTPYNEQIVANDIPGLSAVNTITVRGNGQIIESAGGANWGTITLIGTKYLKFKNLVIRGTGTTNSAALQLRNDARFLEFDSCTFQVSTTTTVTTVNPIVASGSTTSAITAGLNVRDLTITNSLLEGGYYGMTLMGPTTAPFSSNNLITNNVIKDFYLYGLYTTNQENSTFEGNDINRATRLGTLTTFYGWYANGNMAGVKFVRNKIHSPATTNTAATGTAYPVYLTNANATSTNPMLVANNAIYNLNMNGLTYAVYLLSGNFINFYHNSISLDHPTATTMSAQRAFFASASSGTFQFRNNVVSITHTSAAPKHLMYFSSTVPTWQINHNQYYMGSTSGTNLFGYWGTSNVNTFNDWKALNSGAFDANGILADPIFDASQFTPQSSAGNNNGDNLLTQVPNDIFGVARTATPDRGAVEFTPLTCLQPVGIVGSATTNTISLTWVNDPDADSVLVEYGPTGFIQGTGSIRRFTGSTGVLNSNILDATCYDVYVRTYCNGTLGSGQAMITVCTQCLPAAMPYTMDFTTWPPLCWDFATNSSWNWQHLAPQGYAFAPMWSFSTGTATMKSRPVNVTQGARLRFKWAKQYSVSYPNDRLVVRVRELNTGTWDTIRNMNGPTFNSPNSGTTTPPTNASDFVEETVILNPAFIGKVLEIEFLATTGFGPHLYIDQVVVEAVPSCIPPVAVTASNITANSAQINWATINGTCFKIEYGPVGFSVGTGQGSVVHNTTSPTTLSGLAPNTFYHVYVADCCDSTNFTGPLTFKTNCLSQLSGTYTIGGPAGPTNFATLDSAINVLTGCGVSGPVTFNIAPGIYTRSWDMLSINGASATNTVTFQGASVATTTITVPVGTQNAWGFSGTSHITFRNIHFNGHPAPRAFWLRNNANNLTWENCILVCDTVTSALNSGVIVASNSATSPSTAGTNASNITIKNSVLKGGYYTVAMYGPSTTQYSSGLVIEDCQFRRVWGYAIMSYYMENISVQRNILNGTRATFGYGYYGFHNKNFQVNQNRFRVVTYGIYISQGNNLGTAPAAASEIVNNMAIGTGNTGIWLTTVNNVNVYHNSTRGNTYGMYATALTGANIRNNIFSGNNYAFYAATAFANTPVNYNVYHSTGANFAYWGVAYADLNAWKAAVPALNVNSIQGNPGYADPASNLSIIGTLPNDVGVNGLAAVDVFGNVRPASGSTVVDIGAHEFTPKQWDAENMGILTSLAGCGDSAMPVSVVVRNLGLNTITSLPVNVQVTGGLTATLNATASVSIPSGGIDTVIVGTVNTFAGPQGVNFAAVLAVANDQDASNDNASAGPGNYIPFLPSAFTPDSACLGADSATFMAMPVTGVTHGWFANPADTVAFVEGDTARLSISGQNTWYLGYVGSGPSSLTTTFAGGNSCGGGTMINITAIKSLSITGFQVNSVAAAGSAVPFSLYFIPNGTYLGNELNPSAWTLHSTTSGTAAGTGQPTLITLTTPFVIPAGATYAVYLNYNSSYTNGTGANQVYSNADMTVNAGIGLCGLFSGANNPRVFNGTILYGGESCSNIKVPVTVPTLNPSVIAAFLANVQANGATVDFNASGSVGSTYDWYFGDGNQSLNAGPIVQHTYATGGTYLARLVVTESRCGLSDTLDVQVLANIGLGESILGQTLAAFPNPNTGVFTVRIAGSEAFEGQLEVLNLMGQVVTATAVDKRSASLDVNLDLSDYAKGIYMVRLSGSEGQAVLRVVVR